VLYCLCEPQRKPIAASHANQVVMEKFLEAPRIFPGRSVWPTQTSRNAHSRTGV